MNVQFCWIVRDDMPEILAIERASYAFPWSEQDFLEALLERGCIGVVAKMGQRVAGFVLYDTRLRSLEIVNLAVVPDLRRRGIGRQLIEFLKEKLSQAGRNELVTCVGDDSLDAQLFLRKQGFLATAIMRNHFAEHDGDAYLMKYVIDTPLPIFRSRNRISRYFDLEV